MVNPVCIWLLLAILAVAPGEHQDLGVFTARLEAEAREPVTSPHVRLAELERELRDSPHSLKLASEYRLLVIELKAYDRSAKFLEELARSHPQMSNAWINAAFALIDRIPEAGAISQLKLGRAATGHLTNALTIEPTFVAYYVRGLVALYYPAIFNTTRRGVGDLERAVEIAKHEDQRSYHARAWMSLGDGYWKLKDGKRSLSVWSEGLARFPDDPGLASRLNRTRQEIGALISRTFNPRVRMDTSLRQLFEPADASVGQ